MSVYQMHIIDGGRLGGRFNITSKVIEAGSIITSHWYVKDCDTIQPILNARHEVVYAGKTLVVYRLDVSDFPFGAYRICQDTYFDSKDIWVEIRK